MVAVKKVESIPVDGVSYNREEIMNMTSDEFVSEFSKYDHIYEGMSAAKKKEALKEAYKMIKKGEVVEPEPTDEGHGDVVVTEPIIPQG